MFSAHSKKGILKDLAWLSFVLVNLKRALFVLSGDKQRTNYRWQKVLQQLNDNLNISDFRFWNPLHVSLSTSLAPHRGWRQASHFVGHIFDNTLFFKWNKKRYMAVRGLLLFKGHSCPARALMFVKWADDGGPTEPLKSEKCLIFTGSAQTYRKNLIRPQIPCIFRTCDPSGIPGGESYVAER